MSTLLEALQERSEHIILPSGRSGTVVSKDIIHELSATHEIPGHTIERKALLNGIIPLRYSRNMDTISLDDQAALLGSCIGQVGLGGLGGSLLDIFLRVGIGTIKGADGDIFEESNLNRQALSKPDELNLAKAQAASNRAAEINSSVEFLAYDSFLDADTFPEFLESCDVAIDALGGLASRLPLQQAAADANIPLVSGGLAGWTGFVGVVMPGQIGPASIMGRNNAAEEKLGCPAPAVNTVAAIMATEVTRLLTGGASPLEGKMLLIDLQTQSYETITL